MNIIYLKLIPIEFEENNVLVKTIQTTNGNLIQYEFVKLNKTGENIAKRNEQYFLVKTKYRRNNNEILHFNQKCNVSISTLQSTRPSNFCEPKSKYEIIGDKSCKYYSL